MKDAGDRQQRLSSLLLFHYNVYPVKLNQYQLGIMRAWREKKSKAIYITWRQMSRAWMSLDAQEKNEKLTHNLPECAQVGKNASEKKQSRHVCPSGVPLSKCSDIILKVYFLLLSPCLQQQTAKKKTKLNRN